jgi:hypothetical protein
MGNNNHTNNNPLTAWIMYMNWKTIMVKWLLILIRLNMQLTNSNKWGLMGHSQRIILEKKKPKIMVAEEEFLQCYVVVVLQNQRSLSNNNSQICNLQSDSNNIWLVTKVFKIYEFIYERIFKFHHCNTVLYYEIIYDKLILELFYIYFRV